MDSRIHKITFKVSANEREELNKLLKRKRCNISDVIREALKKHYSLDGFEASYLQTASNSYVSKWRLY